MKLLGTDPGIHGRSVMITLWPYQKRGIDDIRALFKEGRRRVCYAAPTAPARPSCSATSRA